MAEIETKQVQGRGVESFADDLVTGRGVVFSRAATILRSVETKPSIGRFAIHFFIIHLNAVCLIDLCVFRVRSNLVVCIYLYYKGDPRLEASNDKDYIYVRLYMIRVELGRDTS